MTARDMQNKHS